MSEELKPCPFCNSSAIPGQVHAQCSNSACPAFHIKTTPARWNRRAQPAEQKDEPAFFIIETPRIIENGEVKEWFPAMTRLTGEELSNFIGPYRIVDKLYRRPAAQAVKLPKRRNERPLGNWTTAETYREAKGFNEALDAVAKLNGSEP